MDSTASVAELQRTVSELTSRVERIEARLETLPGEPPIPPDILTVISAAVAAYLGKRAPVRFVAARRDTTWARQGRAAVQTSHTLPRPTRFSQAPWAPRTPR
jgi:methylmalonyl-CoA carboxyltransferase large subunit